MTFIFSDIEIERDWQENDLRTVENVANINICSAYCKIDVRCEYWIFDLCPKKVCWLKTKDNGRMMRKNFISGAKVCENKGEHILGDARVSLLFV